MTGKHSAASEIQTFQSNPARQTAWIIVPAALVATAFDVLRSWVLHIGGVGEFVAILLSVAAAVGIIELVIFAAAIREVRCSDMYVEFVRGGQVLRVAWHDLIGPTEPYAVGSLTLRYRRGGVLQPDGLGLSREQARGVLSYPKCPRFDLSHEILRSIGLEAYPRSE